MPNHPKILLIEDDIDDQEVIEAVLRNRQYRVISTRDPEKGVEYFKEHPDFDLVLCDLHMPVMNGVKVVQALRELQKDIRILIITGDPDSLLAEQVLAAGAVAIVVKPFLVRHLQEAITAALIK